MDTILNEFPLIKTTQNFLTPEECQEIIELSKNKLTVGQVVDYTGDGLTDLGFRDADSCSLEWDKHEVTKRIYQRVSEYTGYNINQFESFVVTHYKPGQHFRVHQDYFVWYDDEEARKKTDERCKGGNRISTIIMYLNDVPVSGETYFPWMDIKVKPETGKLCQFNYGYDEWNYNVRSQHASVPFSDGEKWIITIWVHEQDVSAGTPPDYKKFYQESKIQSHVKNAVFELEVGPEHDRRMMRLELPSNNDPRNTLLVAFTGGVESALLLYLIAVLNQHLVIPYIIQPVCVTSIEEEDRRRELGDLTAAEIVRPNSWRINEDWPNVTHMVDVIRKLADARIKDVFWISTRPNVKREYHVYSGMNRILNYEDNIESLRYCYEHKFVFYGSIESPTDRSDPRWKNYPPLLDRGTDTRNVRPFQNLQKYHIIDALIQLDVLDIAENTSYCPLEHESLDSECPSGNYACNHRRWAWTMINRHDLGTKYLLKGNRK